MRQGGVSGSDAWREACPEVVREGRCARKWCVEGGVPGSDGNSPVCSVHSSWSSRQTRETELVAKFKSPLSCLNIRVCHLPDMLPGEFLRLSPTPSWPWGHDSAVTPSQIHPGTVNTTLLLAPGSPALFDIWCRKKVKEEAAHSLDLLEVVA